MEGINSLFQQFANGLALGSIYALIAVGFTMVYGILFFINLPHGDMMMVGTYVVAALIGTGIGLFISVIAGIVFTAILAVTIELLAYRRLRQARRVAPVLSAIGVSYVLANGIMVTAGPRPRPFPPSPFSGQLEIGGVAIPYTILITIAVTVIVAIVLELFIQNTRLGTAIRAASQDFRAASLVGINVNRVISTTFAISGALAVSGGVMLGWRYGNLSPHLGFAFMLKAFAACVLGGIGNIRGAILGGLILGMVEVFAVGYVSSAFRDIIAFSVLIVVLLIRPSGILGGRTDVAV